MSSSLSAAENVARQGQNVRSDLKKKMEETSRAVELALEPYFGLFLVCAVQEKCLNYSEIIIFIFWYHCDAVDA